MKKHQKSFHRLDRVQEQMLRDLAEIIRSEVHDPRLNGVMINLNEMEVARDYSHATVYYTVLGSDDFPAVQEALEHAQGFLRTELAHRNGLFRTPELHFKYDEVIDRARYLSNLIEKANQEPLIED